MDIFKDQNYSKLRKHHQDLGVPWTDASFPANDSSIGLNKAKELVGVEWRRATDLCINPRLVKDGIGRHDVIQGKLGNCWFVAAASVLAGVYKLWERVLPDYEDQEWDNDKTDKYSGVFRFRFWRFGQWTEVLVDDLIPTREGLPIFTYSRDIGEYWGALLEKAYAKLHGSYEALDGGNLSDALVDFTGGVAELILLQTENGVNNFKDDDARLDLFSRISKEVEEHALVCCAIRSSGGGVERTEQGLVRGHAYGITALKRVPIGSSGLTAFFKGRDKISLVRLRNPWGEKEWTGPFSDKSAEWKTISERQREKIGLVTEDDGEFWMSWDDFVVWFTDLSINHLINTSLFSFTKTWKQFKKIGCWVRPNRAGGCVNHKETFLNNPQYRFDVTGKEEEEIIIQLTQKDFGSTFIDRKKLVIGVQLLRVEGNRKYRVHEAQTGSEVDSSDYIRSRHIFFKTKLKAGRYVVLPTTFNPGEEGEFLLRLFGDALTGLVELVDDQPPDPPCLACGLAKNYQAVTRLTVSSAQDLPKKSSIGSCDPYLVVKCEGESVRSPIVTNALNPRFNFSVVFFRKKLDKPIKIQVWDNNLMIDSFLGQTAVEAKDKSDPSNPFGNASARGEQKFDLFDRGRNKEEKLPGVLNIITETHGDLSAF